MCCIRLIRRREERVVIVEVYKKDQSAVLQGGQQMMIRMVGVLFCVQLSQFDKWYNSSSSSGN